MFSVRRLQEPGERFVVEEGSQAKQMKFLSSVENSDHPDVRFRLGVRSKEHGYIIGKSH